MSSFENRWSSSVLLGLSKLSLCSISAPQLKIALLLDALQLLMLFVEALEYLKRKTVLLIMVYSGPF
jgi:hypothetical protein